MALYEVILLNLPCLKLNTVINDLYLEVMYLFVD